jgi:hypothetical protein
MEQELGIKLVEAFQTLEAKFADQETSKYLHIEPGTPILFIERIMYTTKQKPIELVQSSTRGDSNKYILRLKNVGNKNDNRWMADSKSEPIDKIHDIKRVAP